MCKTGFGSQGVFLDGIHQKKIDKTLMERETPPPLHDNFHKKNPFLYSLTLSLLKAIT